MTPNEIADKLDYAAGVYGDSGLSQAANTIRELELQRDNFATLYASASKDHGIENAKLKIATEALYMILTEDMTEHELRRFGSGALARIKATNV